ncbi:MAG: hypothetical protein K2X87_00690 [Gemmataceae bacterium]|nr:hypothetical protein [Gemmataceae bacterium]
MPTSPFDPSAYGPAVPALLAEPRLPALGPGEPVAAGQDALARFDPLRDLGGAVADPDAARACHAGLWLLFDFLDESHTISQDLHTPEGSFWHAVMHRREPDAANSKYWWRRVGPHPVLDRLRAEAPAVGHGFRTPEGFVDFCERARDTGSADEATARQVQLLEWQLLFDHCYRLAVAP